jgi:NTE family protein
MNPMRRAAATLSCALSACLIPSVATAVESDSAIQAPQRPRIGLVLAGGGAKGGAHVGVLKVLEEMRVPVDCIAGTSMGALIGAGYASGQPAAQLETFVNGIDWSIVVGGVGRRTLKPVEENRLATESHSPVNLGIQNGAIVTPSGFVNTSSIDDLLRSYVAQARLVKKFDELPIPYRAIATDMVTGNMVVLDEGDLATAMRASMAIPGAFSPVLLDDKILADGGMVRNIPVDVARSMCADIVIVVNLVEPSTPPEKLVQATQLLARSMEVMLEANEITQLKSLTERDIRIDVPMGDIGTADFHRVPETIPLGETAARAAAGRLATLALSESEYTAWRQEVTTGQEFERRVANVRFEGLEKVNPEFLRARSKIRPGDTIDIGDVSSDARRMAALDDLEAVAYRLEGDADNTTLVWLPKESSVGHNILTPSVGVFADGGGDLKFQLSVQHVRRWLNDRGAQWRNVLEVGYESQLSSSFYQPFDHEQRFFVEPELSASRTAENLFNDGHHVATYRFIDLGGRVDLGWNLSHAGQLRLGYWASDREAKVRTGLEQLPEADVLDAGLEISARYDSRNMTSFATSGLSAAVEYKRSDDSFGADRDWERIEAAFRKAIPVGSNLVWLSLAGGTDLDDNLPGDRAFALGGPRTLSAYQHDEIRARTYWLAEASFLRRLKVINPVKNQAVFGGLGLWVAGVEDRVDPVPDDELYGLSAYVAGPTPIGTFTLGVGAAEDSWAIWLAIGRPVARGSILDDGLFR